MSFPCAPPRMIPDAGYIDTLNSISHADVYSNTRRFVNPFAAMPSMHQGYSLLFAITVVIMLRSEILSSPSETNDDNDTDDTDTLLSKQSDSPHPFLTTLRLYMNHVSTRYQLLARETRRDSRKLYLLSFLPFLLLLYPMFMFVVIVGTGNHFVLDAIAGAGAFSLAVLFFPFVSKALHWVSQTSSHVYVQVMKEKVVEDVEMGVKKEEEKTGFLSFTLAETA